MANARFAVGSIVSVLPDSDSRLDETLKDSTSVPSARRSSMTPVLPSTTGSENVITRLAWMLASVVPLAGDTSVLLGATVSTTKATFSETGETLPAASVAVAPRTWVPSESGVEGVKLQLPLPSAVTVPSSVVPS